MRYFPHILRTVRTGTYLGATRPSRSLRCPELASSYYLCHYRPTSACFCHRLYTSARRSAALPLCPLCPLQPACLPPACHLPATCPPPARHLPAAPASLPACRSSRSARCSSLPAACSARSSQPAAPAAPACPLLCPFCLLCRSSQPACHLPAAPACPPLCPLLPVCKKSETFQSLAFLLSGLGLRQAPPRLSARQSRKPSRTSCSRILAQSATGCFSPSTNRSGHPRLQSSM